MDRHKGSGIDGSRTSVVAGKWVQSCARFVWASVQAGWTTHKILAAEVKQVWRYFTNILEFPGEEMEEAYGKWEGVSMLAWSLRLQVLVDWISKDFKEKGKLQGYVEASYLAKVYLLFRSKRGMLFLTGVPHSSSINSSLSSVGC